METELQRWMFFAAMFAVTALRSRPAWGDRKGREILEYALAFYCVFFVASYALARLVEPGSLVEGAMPRDGFLWWTAAAATAGALGGSLFGGWVRQLTAGRDPDSGELRYRLVADSRARGAPGGGAAKQDGDPAD